MPPLCRPPESDARESSIQMVTFQLTILIVAHRAVPVFERDAFMIGPKICFRVVELLLRNDDDGRL